MKYKIGDKIKHKAFGLGIIIGISTKPDIYGKSMYNMLINKPNIVLKYIDNPCIVSEHNLIKI